MGNAKKAKLFTCQQRVQIAEADLELLRSHSEITEDLTHIPGQCLRRYTLRGVPARRVDLALPLEAMNRPLVLEIETKLGRFDHETRTRLTVRHWNTAPGFLPGVTTLREAAGPIPKGRVMIDRRQGVPSVAVDSTERDLDAVGDGVHEDALQEAGEILTVVVLWSRGVGYWSQEFACLRSDLLDYDLEAVVYWHWNRYFLHLSFEDVQPLAMAFEASHPTIRAGTLAEANRQASRDLYRLSRDLGWRKLTLSERVKYGFSPDDGSWMRLEKVERRRMELGYPTRSGAGQYTLEAAAGQEMTQAEADGYIQTAHGRVEVE